MESDLRKLYNSLEDFLKDNPDLQIEKEKIVTIEDVRRIEYVSDDFDSLVIYIMDWEEGRWTNSCRYSMGAHVWSPCSVDEDLLKREFDPIAERLEVNYSDIGRTNVATLVETAMKESKIRLIRDYRERLEREPYPGEIKRGETPGINVALYQKSDGTNILIKEKKVF